MLKDEHLSQIRDRAHALGTTPEEPLRTNIETRLVAPQDDLDKIADYLVQKPGSLPAAGVIRYLEAEELRGCIAVWSPIPAVCMDCGMWMGWNRQRHWLSR